MKKIFRITLWCILGITLITIIPIGLSLLTEQVTASTTIPSKSELREGDLIFYRSESRQSTLIVIGTQSNITHCGIIVFRDSKPYVYEASRTVMLTPLKKFINRGKDGKFWIKRPKFPLDKKIKLSQLGQKYDLAFKFDNGKMYCSELVYVVYKEQFGVELCKPKKVKDYLYGLDNIYPKLKKEMKRRGITLEQDVVAPVDIFNSEYLESTDF